MADRSTPLRSGGRGELRGYLRRGRGLHLLGGIGLRLQFGTGLSILCLHCDRLRSALDGGSYSGSGLRGLRSGLGTLGQRPAQCCHIDGAIGLWNYRPDLRQTGVVQDEGLIFGGHAIEDAVRFGAGEQATLADRPPARLRGIARYRNRLRP